MRKIINKVVSGIMAVALICSNIMTPKPQQTTKAQITSGQIANVVVFVDFQDTKDNHPDHTEKPAKLGPCYKENPADTFALFDGDENHQMALKQYINKVSYGALEVVNIYPQYNAVNNTIDVCLLSQNSSYYFGNYDVMIDELLQNISFSENADRNGDGVIDNLTVVVPYVRNNGAELFYGLRSGFAGSRMINGLRVGDYNIIPEGSAYMGLNQSGVIIHEFLHTLGYPDLYRARNSLSTGTGVPVYQWDIMSAESKAVQYPLAYFRSKVSGWISINEISNTTNGYENEQTYTLYAPTATTNANKNQQALILKTGYSNSEFFVVEYRKKGATQQDYEYTIPGSGLIIYRINTNQVKNLSGQTDYAYIFRPGDSYDSYGHEKGEGDYFKAFLSAESGRTGYGSENPADSLQDGAIVYSDGVNSGIEITEVGSAAGDTISFRVTFHDVESASGGYWQTNADKTLTGTTVDLDSIMDDDGNIFTVRATNSGFSVMKYANETSEWETLASKTSSGVSYKIAEYGGKLYVAFVDYNNDYKVVMYQLENGSFTKVFTSAQAYINEVDMDADDTGIYLLYGNGASMYCEKYTTTGTTNLGTVVANSDVVNPSITVGNGHVVAMCRHWMTGNRMEISSYANGMWTGIDGGNIYADNAIVRLNGNNAYFMLNGNGQGVNSDYSANRILVYDFSTGNTSQLGSNGFSNISSPGLAMCFNNNVTYAFYYHSSEQLGNHTYLMNLVNDVWTPLGTEVSSEALSGIDPLNAFAFDNIIYVVYETSSGHLYVKSHNVLEQDIQRPSETISVTGVAISNNTLALNTTDTTMGTLTASVVPENATNQVVTWQSSNKSVVNVDDGVVIVVGPGTATISAISEDGGKVATCTVTVTNTSPSEPNESVTPSEPEKPQVEVPTQAMYRLYNPNSGEHFYTANYKEAQSVTAAGWNYEGIAWYAPTSGTPVYRLYNENAGDHHYTPSVSEKDMLIAAGWKYEGIAWYSSGNVPMYRVYNPNAISGSHHYSANKQEIDFLVSIGWRYEGVAWYAIK